MSSAGSSATESGCRQCLYWGPKRAADLAVGVLLAAPAALLVGVAAAFGVVVQGRPVLFRQERVGRDGVPFRLLKLRTMTGAPTFGRAYQEVGRITPYGRILRSLKVDELPQVWHLLTGQMSLVGPRPLAAVHVAAAEGGGRRHQVRPGLTCLAQLELIEHGYLDRHRQVALDEEYLDRACWRMDLAILARSAALLLKLPHRREPLARYRPELAGARPGNGRRIVPDRSAQVHSPRWSGTAGRTGA